MQFCCLTKYYVMSLKEYYMKIAYDEAEKAYAKGEIPIGAVIVKNGEIIAKAHNLRETEKNSLNHAEIVAIDMACKKLGGWRLTDCDMYVTLEPCHMCIGAIIQAKIKNLYFGAYDKKGGAVFSIDEIPKNPKLCHRPECYGGVLEEECSEILKKFFLNLRHLKIKNN